MKNFIYVGLVVVLLSLVSCATVDYSFVNPDAGVAAAKKVAVFPFVLAIDDYAALRVSTAREQASILVTNTFVKELRLRTQYEIIPPGEIIETLSLDGQKMDWICKSFFGDVIERSALTPERLNELGSQLGVDAILAGKVTDFARYQQDGALWTGVGVAIKMVDVKSGEVLWDARDNVKDVSTSTHSVTTIEKNTASYPVVIGAVDKEPKYNTGQGYFYGTSGDFPAYTDYGNVTLKVCRKIVSTLPRY